MMPRYIMDLRGKTAVLTGGKRLGLFAAEALAKKGVNFILSYKNSKAIIKKEALNLQKFGVKAYAFKADAADEKQVKKLFKFAKQKFKKIDILIAMASTFAETPFKKLNKKTWWTELDNTLTSAFLCAKEAGKIMLKQKSSGKIILIGDSAIDTPYKNKLPYFVAKAGVHELTKILAVELAPKITVNCVAPGKVLSPKITSEKLLGKIAQKSNLKKITAPQNVANAILFLLEKADRATGKIIKVDAGRF